MHRCSQGCCCLFELGKDIGINIPAGYELTEQEAERLYFHAGNLVRQETGWGCLYLSPVVAPDGTAVLRVQELALDDYETAPMKN